MYLFGSISMNKRIFLKYIDCHTRFYVVLQENMKSDQQLEKHPRIKLFLQNMLEFPFSCVAIGESVIAAVITVPSSWIASLLLYFQLLELECRDSFSVIIGQHLTLASIFRYTPLFKDLSLTVLGGLMPRTAPSVKKKIVRMERTRDS